MNEFANLRDLDYDKEGRIAGRCRLRVARLHAVCCEYCGSEWRAEHPFCERLECPDCHRLTQVAPDPFDSNFFAPDESLPTEERLR